MIRLATLLPHKFIFLRLTDNAPSEEQISKAIDVISTSNKEPINVCIF